MNPTDPTRILSRRRLRVLTGLAAALGAVSLTACGSAVSGAASAATATTTHQLTGTETFTATPYYLNLAYSAAVSSPCSGRSGYDDLTSGTQVVVKSGAGEVLGVGTLSAGSISSYRPEPADEGGTYQCAFTWSADVADAAFYTVQMGRRSGPTWSRDTLASEGWQVATTITGGN